MAPIKIHVILTIFTIFTIFKNTFALTCTEEIQQCFNGQYSTGYEYFKEMFLHHVIEEIQSDHAKHYIAYLQQRMVTQRSIKRAAQFCNQLTFADATSEESRAAYVSKYSEAYNQAFHVNEDSIDRISVELRAEALAIQNESAVEYAKAYAEVKAEEKARNTEIKICRAQLLSGRIYASYFKDAIVLHTLFNLSLERNGALIHLKNFIIHVSENFTIDDATKDSRHRRLYPSGPTPNQYCISIGQE